MPSIDLNFLTSLKSDYTKYPIFVETGTFMGETILNMEPLFEKLFTYEISSDYYNYNKSSYFGNKIEFLFGDGSKMLPELLTKIDKPTIFFLDAHYSSGFTGKGDEDVPLYEELKSINDFFLEESIIIIDDFRMFGGIFHDGPNTVDWSYINKETSINLIKDRIEDIYHLPSHLSQDDRLILHIKKK